jgi:hypothetical protein
LLILTANTSVLNQITSTPYVNLTNAGPGLQRFDEGGGQSVTRNALAFLGGDSAGMGEQENWFSGGPEENIGLSLASDTKACAGHLGKPGN